MKEFKGTPGSWIASTTDRRIGPLSKDDDQTYGMILPVAWVEFDHKPGHHQANANLIAASPELLAALQSLVEIYDNDGSRFYTTETKQRALDKAKVAIDKALGE